MLIFAAAISPLVIVVSILLGAVVHECGHLLVLRLFHVPIEGLRLTALGAELSARGAEKLSYGRELLVTLSGPAANAVAAVFFAQLAYRTAWPEGYAFAGANVILGAYNLLPIPPLDGGRILYLLVACFFGPMVGDAVSVVVGVICASALLALSIRLSLTAGSGMFLLFAAASLFLGILPQLRLAKGAVKV